MKFLRRRRDQFLSPFIGSLAGIIQGGSEQSKDRWTATDAMCCTSDEDHCPTYVIPGSHRSGRRPDKGEEEWQGRKLEPVLVEAGDVLFFRSEVWHSGSLNRSDLTRYLVQVHYSHRFIAQKFSPWPWQFNPEMLAVDNDRQKRLLGRHPESNYG